MKAETNILGCIPRMVEMKMYYWMDIRKRSSPPKRKMGVRLRKEVVLVAEHNVFLLVKMGLPQM